MKKNLSLRSMLMTSLVILAAVLSSCSKAYKKAIPADAPVVVELDVKHVGAKADFLAQKEQVADLVLSIDPEDRELQKLADAIRSPQDLGLDLLCPIYFFAVSSVDDGYFLAAVKDKEAVIKKLESFSKEIEVTSSDKLAWVEVNSRLLGVITDDVLLLGSSNDRTTYRDLLDNDKSFFSTDAGKFFTKHAEDITATLNMENLSRQAKREVRQTIERELRDAKPYLTDDMWEQLFELQWVVNLEFKSGEFDLNIFVDGAENKKEYDVLTTKVSKDALKQIPERNLIGLLALGIDGPKYCEAIDKAMDETDTQFSGEEKMVYGMIKQVLRKTNGTLAFALSGKDIDDPDFLCLVPTPMEEVQPYIALFESEIPKEIRIDGDAKGLSVTNIATYEHGEAKPAFEHAANATSSYLYGYVDAEPLVETYFTERTRRTIPEEVRFLNAWRNLADLFDYLQLKADRRDAVSFEFILHEDDDNALALLLKQGIMVGAACVEYDKVRAARYQVEESIFDEDYYDFGDVEWEEVDD